MKLFSNRIEMIKTLVPVDSICAEIGVFEGTFSAQIADSIRPKCLYMIDIFSGWCESGNEDGNNVVRRNMDDVYIKLSESTKANKSLRVLKGKSVEILETFPDNSLDMVYVDGDHGYLGCAQDMAVCYKKVRSGGWIFGHDYEMNMSKAHNHYIFGVRQAVDEFCNTYNQQIIVKALDGCVSFGIQLVK